MHLHRIAFCSAAVFLASTLMSAGPATAGGDYAMASPSDNGFRLGIGGAVGFKPKYEGSDEYEAFGFPIIFPKFGDTSEPSRLKFRGLDDVRYVLFRDGWFEAGPLGGYNFGRDQDDATTLLGLGDVDGGVVLGAFVGIRIWEVLFDVSYHHQVSGDDTGYQLRFGAEVDQQVAPGVELVGRVGTTFASSNYMDAYFAITPAQSAASFVGLPVFNTSSGIKDVHVELGAKFDLDERWALRMGVKYARLVGDAADSPITQSEDQFTGSIGITYLVDWYR